MKRPRGHALLSDLPGTLAAAVREAAVDQGIVGSRLHERTAKKYIGAMASNYEAKRKKQLRWHHENKILTEMLGAIAHADQTVLDVPVGTGRFLPLYAKHKLKGWGLDTSEEMLAQARKKSGAKNLKLSVGNVLTDDLPKAHIAISVRFLDLIDEPAMLIAMDKLMAATNKYILLTIRFGDQYVLKSNTATHNRRKFMKRIAMHGWRVAEDVPIFSKGWCVLKLAKVRNAQ